MKPKGWGPFSGSQLTIMVVTTLLSLAVPGMLWASGVNFSYVSVYDPSSGRALKLGRGGAVPVISGPTPLLARVYNGSAPINVSGTVTAPEASPKTFISFYQEVSSVLGCVKLVEPPAGKGVIITRILLSTFNNPSPGSAQVVVFYRSSSACDTVITAANPGGLGIDTLDFGPGIAVAGGQSLWASVLGSVATDITGLGYTLPASEVASEPAIARAGLNRAGGVQLR